MANIRARGFRVRREANDSARQPEQVEKVGEYFHDMTWGTLDARGVTDTVLDRLAEIEKFLDTVAICPSQLGQIGALWGMQNLAQWVAGERAEILARRAAMEGGFTALPDWKLLCCGAYFAYVEHPFDIASDSLCKRLVAEAGLLMLPGTMFQPEGSQAGKRQIRIAFANADASGIAEMFRRLAAWRA